MTTAVLTGNTYDKYASTNPIERRLMTGFFDALVDSLPAEAPATVLEVGVGEGEVSARLRRIYPSAQVVGVDLPDEGLAAQWRSSGLVGLCADIAGLPFPSKTFDLVMAIEVLEHVPDPEHTLSEMRRIARSHLLVSVPREPLWRALNMARGAYWGSLGNTPGHLNHWSKRSFERLLSRHGTVEQARSPFPWTMLLVRL